MKDPKPFLFFLVIIVLIGVYVRLSSERYVGPKYLLVKGWCGFADRLQCISAAMTYTKKHNRVMCIDWTDSIWKGQTPDMNFDTFFDITCEGLQTVPLSDLLSKQNELSVYPSIWKGQLDKKPDIYMYEKPYQINLDSDPVHEEDVIVYTSTELRTYHHDNITKCIRIKEPYRTRIRNSVDMYKNYKTVVHLRGSDRVKPDQYEEYIQSNFDSKMKHKSDEEVLIVSDTEPLFKYFQEKYPKSMVRTPSSSYTSSSDPTKTLHQDGNIDKIDFNTQTLIDFFIIMYAENCIRDDKSLFSSVSRHIREGGEKYKNILA